MNYIAFAAKKKTLKVSDSPECVIRVLHSDYKEQGGTVHLAILLGRSSKIRAYQKTGRSKKEIEARAINSALFSMSGTVCEIQRRGK